MTPDRLYVYQHKACGLTMHANTRALPDAPYHCRNCGGAMRFLFDYPVETERHAAIWQKGQYWGGPLPGDPPPVREKRCLMCPTRRDPATYLDGKYCSPACMEQHSKQIQAIKDRVEAEYKERPWLRPTA